MCNMDLLFDLGKFFWMSGLIAVIVMWVVMVVCDIIDIGEDLINLIKQLYWEHHLKAERKWRNSLYKRNEIRYRLRQGEKYRDIAKEVHTSIHRIRKIAREIELPSKRRGIENGC